MTISIVYSIMTTIRVGGAKSFPEGLYTPLNLTDLLLTRLNLGDDKIEYTPLKVLTFTLSILKMYYYKLFYCLS